MSSELERLLRRAGEALPEPHPTVTRRARGVAIGSGFRGARFPLVVGVALLAACGLGVVLGASTVSTGQAASPAVGFGFLPESGWSVLQTGRAPSSTRPAQAIAANVRLSSDDDVDELPYATLLGLPPRGVVIIASFIGPRDEPDHAFPARVLPLRLRTAAPEIEWGVQVRPARPLGQYQLRAHVNGQAIDVHVYFGTEQPRASLLADAQRQLDRLVVGSGPPLMGVSERALPLRSPTGAARRVIDSTLLCSTVASGGIREIEVRANAGFRQGSAWKTLAFAVVASGGVGSRTTVLNDSLGWVGAGRYAGDTNLTDDSAFGVRVPIPAQTFGTLALSRRSCKPTRAQVPLSGKGLQDAAPGPLGVTFDCATPRQILIRVRAVAYATPLRYRDNIFDKTRAPLRTGYLAVRTQAGKQLAFASVSDTGKARLLVASSCVED